MNCYLPAFILMAALHNYGFWLQRQISVSRRVGASLHDYTKAFGNPCIFEFSGALSFAARSRWNPACEPVRVFLQKEC